MPQRVQLSRRKGWRMPPNTVKVCRPTVWGNPFRVGDFGQGIDTPEIAVAMYSQWLQSDIAGMQIAAAAKVLLRGRNLACWCPLDQPCHADVLLEIANGKGGDP